MARFTRAGPHRASGASPYEVSMSRKQLALQLVPGKSKPAIAIDIEIAQTELRALKFLQNMSKEERPSRVNELVDCVRSMTVVAADLVAMTKSQLSTDLGDTPDVFVQIRSDIAKRKESAKVIVDLISAAEARLAVSLAK
jgi:hypothetical protein